MIIPGLVRYKYYITALYFLINYLSITTIGLLELSGNNEEYVITPINLAAILFFSSPMIMPVEVMY